MFKMKVINYLKIFIRASREYFIRWLKCQRVQLHNPSLTIIFPLNLVYDSIDAIRIGKNVSLGAFLEIVVIESSAFSNIQGKLIIEDGVCVGSHSNIRAAGGEVFIGSNAKIGQHVSLIASNHTISESSKVNNILWDETKTGIFIGQNVWIGAGVIILPGCKIGDNSVIGAGSVVTKCVPSYEMWGGVPARKIRSIRA